MAGLAQALHLQSAPWINLAYHMQHMPPGPALNAACNACSGFSPVHCMEQALVLALCTEPDDWAWGHILTPLSYSKLL